MDPDATLARIRELVQQTDVLGGCSGDTEELVTVAYQLAELTGALDGWLTRGGFLPEAWRTEERR